MNQYFKHTQFLTPPKVPCKTLYYGRVRRFQGSLCMKACMEAIKNSKFYKNTKRNMKTFGRTRIDCASQASSIKATSGGASRKARKFGM
eukprot:3714873-Amphidinium_carterae.1